MAIYEVIFRQYEGETLAVFPAEPWDEQGNLTCYAHVGQHGPLSLDAYRASRPAGPKEVETLYNELKNGPYKDDVLHVMKRQTLAAIATRNRRLNEWRQGNA